MQRIPEPELMDAPEQARAYALADFAEPHNRFIELLREHFPDTPFEGCVLDLGCGPADITLRFARAFPACELLGIDGAREMLKLGEAAIIGAGLGGRVSLHHAYLPGGVLPRGKYQALISNSPLHHLADPQVLWQTIRDYAAPGAPVFVMDLMRPESREQAVALVQRYAGNEAEVLRHDFLHSLLAAYRPLEVRTQLQAAGLDYLQVEAVSDRHLIVHGRLR